ncbi:MAG: hypothetical protein LBS11_00635, partial [Oscillospiraceae bacterium]|nr:hypothetical protein [Oscillospiraceae bacterium]
MLDLPLAETSLQPVKVLETYGPPAPRGSNPIPETTTRDRLSPDYFGGQPKLTAPLITKEKREQYEQERAKLLEKKSKFDEAALGQPTIADTLAPLARQTQALFKDATGEQAANILEANADSVPDWYSGLLYQMMVYTEWGPAELLEFMPFATHSEISAADMAAGGASETFVNSVIRMREDLTEVLRQPVAQYDAGGWMGGFIGFYTQRDEMVRAAASARGQDLENAAAIGLGVASGGLAVERGAVGAGEFIAGVIGDVTVTAQQEWARWVRTMKELGKPGRIDTQTFRQNALTDDTEYSRGPAEVMEQAARDELDRIDEVMGQYAAFVAKHGSNADNFAFTLARDITKQGGDQIMNMAVGPAWFAVQGFGQNWADTREAAGEAGQPESKLRRALSASIAGSTEWLTNKIFGRFSDFSDVMAAKLGVNKLASTGGQAVLRSILSAVGEGVEEFVQTGAEVAQDLIMGDPQSAKTYLQDALRSAMSAFMTSMPFGAGGAADKAIQSARDAQAARTEQVMPVEPTAPTTPAQTEPVMPAEPTAQTEPTTPARTEPVLSVEPAAPTMPTEPAAELKPLVTPDMTLAQALTIAGGMPETSAGYQAVMAISQKLEAGASVTLPEIQRAVNVVMEDSRKPEIIRHVNQQAADLEIGQAKTQLILEGVLDQVLEATPGYASAKTAADNALAKLQDADAERVQWQREYDTRQRTYQAEAEILANPAAFALDTGAAERYKTAKAARDQARDKLTEAEYATEDAEDALQKANTELDAAERRATRILQTQAVERVQMAADQKPRNAAYASIKREFGLTDSSRSLASAYDQTIQEMINHPDATPESVYAGFQDIAKTMLETSGVDTDRSRRKKELRFALKNTMISMGKPNKSKHIPSGEEGFHHSSYQINSDLRRQYFGKLMFGEFDHTRDALGNRSKAASPLEALQSLAEDYPDFITPGMLSQDYDGMDALLGLVDDLYKPDTFASEYGPDRVSEGAEKIASQLYRAYTGAEPPASMTLKPDMDIDEAQAWARDAEDEARIAQIEEIMLREPLDAADFAPIADAAELVNMGLPADPATLAASVEGAGDAQGVEGAGDAEGAESESVYSEDGLAWPKVSAGEAKRMAALMAGLSERVGVTIEFADDARQGLYDPETRVIVLSNKLNGYETVAAVLGHEITHPLQGTPEYAELRSFLFENTYRGVTADLKAALADTKARYKEAGIELTDAGAREELTADLVKRMVEDSHGEILTNLAMEKPTIAQRFLSLIRSAVDAIKRLTWDADKRDEYKTLHRAETLLGEAMDAAAVGRGGTDGEVQYFINPEFQRDFDAWDHRDGDVVFYVGTTSEALRGIGVEDKSIRWHASKIIRTQLDHPAMTDDVIRQVPNILENPVVVMESKKTTRRVTMLGEINDAAGVPVLAVLDLVPTAATYPGLEVESLRLVSTYGKDANLQSFLSQSRMMYIDPDTQRTKGWLARNGLTLNVPPERYGVLGRVQDKVTGDNRVPRLQLPSEAAAPVNNSSISQRGGDVQYSIPGETSSQRRKLDALRKKFGTMEPGRNLETGAVLLPKRTDNESAVSRTVRTIMETGRLAESLSPEFLDGVIAGKYSHKVQGDAQARKFAENALGQGLLEARGKWDYAMASGKINKNMIVLGQELLKEYARIGDKQGAADIVGDLTFTLTETGQRLQAMTLLKNSGAVGSSMYYSKLVKQIN